MGHPVERWRKEATRYSADWAKKEKQERRRGRRRIYERRRGYAAGLSARWIFSKGGDASREIKSQYRSWIYEKVIGGDCPLRRDSADKTVLWTEADETNSEFSTNARAFLRRRTRRSYPSACETSSNEGPFVTSIPRLDYSTIFLRMLLLAN